MRPTLAALLVLALTAAACSDSDPAEPPAAPTPPAAVSPSAAAAREPRINGDCAPPEAKLTAIPTEKSQVDAAILGDGSTAIVVAYESNGQICPWVPYARTLAEKGFRVALFDYSVQEPEEDVLTVTGYLRDSGATKVYLMGGSLGGIAVLRAANKLAPRPAGLINLSGGLPDGVEQIKTLKSPVLLIAANDDPSLENLDHPAPQWMNSLYKAATQAPSRKLLLVSGTGHASDLLATPKVRAAIEAFLGKPGLT